MDTAGRGAAVNLRGFGGRVSGTALEGHHMRRRQGVALVVAAMVVVAIPAFAAVGDVDTTYGTGGYLEIPDDGGPHWIGAMAARPTGEAILTGSMIGGGSGEQSFWVTEVAADGTSRSDATGIVLGAEFELGTAITIAPDGKFIVAGERGSLGGADTDMFTAKFNADLSLYSGYNDSDPVTPDGTYVYDRAGTERVTTVFMDGTDTVVGGWDESGDRDSAAAGWADSGRHPPADSARASAHRDGPRQPECPLRRDFGRRRNRCTTGRGSDEGRTFLRAPPRRGL